LIHGIYGPALKTFTMAMTSHTFRLLSQRRVYRKLLFKIDSELLLV
jgi:hypothetical protein